ncbi:MAG: HAMP domain-containing protein, partial [Planctomycetota bacterium]
MSIKWKIAAIVGTPLLAVLFLVVFGLLQLNSSADNTRTIVDVKFKGLLEDEVMPLIDNEMLPLIQKDIAELHALQKSIELMLEADRDAHQALVAEKMSLSATSSEMEEIKNTHAENIEQARVRMEKASAAFSDDKLKEKYADFSEKFALWKTKTTSVIEKASTPGKLRFALRGSNKGGSAHKAFHAMRDIIDQLQGMQAEMVAQVSKKVDIKKSNLLSKKSELDTAEKAVINQGQEIIKETNSTVYKFLIVGIVAFLFSVVLAYLVSTKLLTAILKATLLTAILKATDFAETVYKGNLTTRLNLASKDEIGKLSQSLDKMADGLQSKADAASEIANGNFDININLTSSEDSLGKTLQRMADQLNETLLQVQEASAQVNSGSHQINDASQSLSQGATESAASLE